MRCGEPLRTQLHCVIPENHRKLFPVSTSVKKTLKTLMIHRCRHRKTCCSLKRRNIDEAFMISMQTLKMLAMCSQLGKRTDRPIVHKCERCSILLYQCQ